MRQLKRVSVIAVCLLAFVACSGQRSVIIDTIGLTPEQITAVEWKARYAVALDWYDLQMASFETSLNMLPLDQAKELYAKAETVTDAAFTALQTFRAAAYSKSPDPANQQEAYDAFIAAKAAVLKILLTLFN